MKKLLITIVIAIFSIPCLFSQNDTVVLDRNAQPTEAVPAPAPATKASEAEKAKAPKAPKKAKSPLMKRLYFGGTFGATFGTYSSVRINPLIGYKITPKLSAGVTFTYEYFKNKYYSQDLTSNNYGGSLFARFRIIPAIYVHAEYALISYENYYQDLDQIYSVREPVPFLFLGGGYSQRLAGNSWLNFQILFDVLQNEKSPYSSNQPFYSLGVGVGF